MYFVQISRRLLVVCLFVLSVAWANNLKAEPLKAVAEGKKPADDRLQPLKDLNGYFPFKVSATKEDWAIRREIIQRRTLVSLGLWPLPEKTPLNAHVHGYMDQGDYTIEKVYFESLPGFYVTGSLYSPKNIKGKVPAVLCPHGHWADGRFYDDGLNNTRIKITQGAERFEDGGRSPLQARCVQLARMGCIVFHYDMIGYADSVQIHSGISHGFKTQRPEMNKLKDWGLFSPQAEAHLQNVMGLQTWNSIRSLDFLETLPDVDTSRLAVTGGSGGGTQSMILAGVDPRIDVSFPAVMVSTSMQGGCTCENCSLLRIDTGNVEFAALFAPKPQGMTAADDWTVELKTKGFPELKQHYELLGAKDKVTLASLTHFKHNYNYVSRSAMYPWLNKHLKLGHKEPIVEPSYERLEKDQLTVWDNEHPEPKSTPEFERELLRGMTEESNKQIAALTPTDAASFEAFQRVLGGGIDTLIGRGLPNTTDMQYEAINKVEVGEHLEIASLLTLTTDEGKQEQLPLLFIYPSNWNGQAVIWLTENGKHELYNKEGTLIDPVQRLVNDGATVVGVDLFRQGEFLDVDEDVTQTRKVDNKREFAGYTFGYNHSLFAQRVHDVLTVISFIDGHEMKPEKVDLVGIGKAGIWATAARAQARDVVDRAAIDTGGFRFGSLLDYRDPMFLCGGAKYADIPGLLAVAAPSKLLLAGEGKTGPKVLSAAYLANQAKDQIELSTQTGEDFAAEAVDWLLSE
ncbi:MAG: acetylxylan esterase [Pirellulales bacterium]